MSHTKCAPPSDKAMWRRLLAACHPDGGGDGELFTWVTALREHVAGVAIEPPAAPRPRRSREADAQRVPFEPGELFDALTQRALALADEVPEPYAGLLRLLSDCREVYDGQLVREQRRGASYKRLAAVGHVVGMDKQARVRWYKLAESVPLSDRHAGHVLGRLDWRAA